MKHVSLTVAHQRVTFDWGRPHELGTAAYWVDQAHQRPVVRDHRLGTSLAEETAACLLGGHGLPAAVGLAGFEAVRDADLLSGPPPGADEIEAVLLEPLHVAGRSRPVRYRFPHQRAHRLAAALRYLAGGEPPVDGIDLRDWLLGCPGIGPKTASWIARNSAPASDLAIIDIHLRRAGLAAGFFLPTWQLPHHYGWFEKAFCAVARVGDVSAAALDACIWDQLQYLGAARRLVVGDWVFA